MVQDGDISASHARTIVVADDPEKLAKEIKEKKLSVAATDKLVHTTKRSTKSRTYVSHTIDANTLHSMEIGIATAMGAPTKIIERRGGAGQIVLSFASRNELHELVKKLIQK